MAAIILPYIPMINEYTDRMLDQINFYNGYPCVHGHTIRNKGKEWCYHCAHKISQNICGFDINYFDKNYKINVKKFLQFVNIKGPNDCWVYEHDELRHVFPSYRSINAKKRADNMTAMKVMYHIAWGDTGKLYVQRNTKLCSNPKCVNPRHLKTHFNHAVPPKTIHPLEVEYDWTKINHFNHLERAAKVDEFTAKQIKTRILHPTIVPDRTKDTFD